MTVVWLNPALQTHKGFRLERADNFSDHAVTGRGASTVVIIRGKQPRAQELDLGKDQKNDFDSF